MKTQAKVVIIGGGAVGVSTLYHLPNLNQNKLLTPTRLRRYLSFASLENSSYATEPLLGFLLETFQRNVTTLDLLLAGLLALYLLVLSFFDTNMMSGLSGAKHNKIPTPFLKMWCSSGVNGVLPPFTSNIALPPSAGHGSFFGYAPSNSNTSISFSTFLAFMLISTPLSSTENVLFRRLT